MIQSVQTVLILAFPALVIAAALRDAASYTIPNWIALALLAVFPAAALSVSLPLPTLGFNAALGLLALVLGMGMFAVGWIGGGDAKLFAVSALWLGWPAGATCLVVTAIAGGGLTLMLLGLRSTTLRPYIVAGPRWVARLAEPGEGVPYGLAIAAGALVAFPGSAMMESFRALA